LLAYLVFTLAPPLPLDRRPAVKTLLIRAAAMAGVALVLSCRLPTAGAESFSAVVVSGHNPARTTWDGRPADPPLPITIHLDEWSASSDIRDVEGMLRAFGPGAARRLGEDKPVGRVVASSWEFRLGPWRVILASERETATGRLVRLVTACPVFVLSSWSQDAGFDPSTGRLYTGAIELTLDTEGRGTGVLMPVAAVAFDEEGGFTVEKASPAGGAHELIKVKAW
jgi:hypothetical protein